MTAIKCSTACIIGLVYVCNPLHFPSSTPNAAIIRMALVLTPLVIYAFICLLAYFILEEVLAKRQVKFIKKLMALKALSNIETKNKKHHSKRMVFSFGDPYENRTRVTAVKGRCLDRLTNGP